MFKFFQGKLPRLMRPQRRARQRRAGRGLLRFSLVVLCVGLPTAAQSPSVPRGSPFPPQPAISDDASGLDQHMEAKRLAMLNASRQKSMISDAEKLLHLAKELNDDAAGVGASLSPSDRIRKAAEIEKLAKNVKEKMTYVAGSSPESNAAYSILVR
jgi:hypothetical protein